MRKMTIALILLAVCVIVCGSAVADNGVSVRPEKIVGKAGEHVEIQVTCDFEPGSIEAIEGGLHILGGVPPDLGGPNFIPILGLHPLALSTVKPQDEPLLGAPIDRPILWEPPFFIKGKVFGFKLKYASGYRETYYLSTPGMLYELYEAKDYIGKPLKSYVGQYVGVYSCRHDLIRPPKPRLPSPGEKIPYEKIVWVRPRIEVNAITPYDATQQDYIGTLGFEELSFVPFHSLKDNFDILRKWYLDSFKFRLWLFGPENFADTIANTMKENLNKRVRINGPVYKDEKGEYLLLMSIRPEPYKTNIVIGLTEGLITVQELILRIRDKQGAVHDITIPVELPQKLGEKN